MDRPRKLSASRKTFQNFLLLHDYWEETPSTLATKVFNPPRLITIGYGPANILRRCKEMDSGTVISTRWNRGRVMVKR